MNYMKIVPCDIANGEGVRVSLFVSGCSHHCPGCHNPQTWDQNAGVPFIEDTMQQLLDLLRPDYIQGLTFSGGDPLFVQNRFIVGYICERVRKEFGDTKDIWMWTGYEWDQIKDWDHLNYVDVLVDGPYIESKRDISLPYMGSSNQRVIGCNKSFALRRPVLWWTPEDKKGK